ncbi:MAG: KpsF/GutQ family sugar-phosphate isomerase [Pseudomonadota bacterium]
MTTDVKEKVDILTVARQVVTHERNALEALGECLGQDFEDAVRLICGAKGRVIISGMGKSGHIAAKISATLASTGTPAFFVHPGEASHGDLGMVTKDDVVICLSNSGETSELSDLIAYTRRYNIALIGMVARRDSALGTSADIALVIPKVPEACPNGLAPTTSTTMMLALGDALAVALMKLKDFTSDHFRKFHPGGKLGAKLLKVADLMHVAPDIPVVKMDMLMSEILIEMTSKSFGCTAVVDNEGILCGIITDGDLRRSMSDALIGKKASDVMSVHPKTISGTRLATEAVSLLQENSITSVFVTDHYGRPIGLLHIHDCLRAGVI